MSSPVKITLSSQNGWGSKHAFQNIHLVIRTVLKLALINGYDSEGRIRGTNGEFIPNSNLLDLLNFAMTRGKNLKGTDEFVKLLLEAGIEPDWIINENIRSLLLNKSSSVLPKVTPISTGAYWGPEKVTERRLASYTRPQVSLDNPQQATTIPLPPPPPLVRGIATSEKKRVTENVLPPPPTLMLAPGHEEQSPPEPLRMDLPPASPPSEMPTIQRYDNDDAQAEKNKWHVPTDEEQMDGVRVGKRKRLDDFDGNTVKRFKNAKANKRKIEDETDSVPMKRFKSDWSQPSSDDSD